MPVFIPCFALGILLVQGLPTLPGEGVAWGLFAAGLLGLCGVAGGQAWRFRNLHALAAGSFTGSKSISKNKRVIAAHCALCLGAMALGAGWALLRAEWRLADELPGVWERRDVTLQGVVVGLPQQFERGVRFDFVVEEASGPVPRRLRLSWYARGGAGQGVAAALPLPQAGERWQFTARLRRPHGSANPQGFDYQAWLLERGIRATGSVRTQEPATRLDARVWQPAALLHQVRAGLRARILAALGDAPQAGVMVALAVGDQQAIAPPTWQVFRATGVNHLVAISGLHVSLVALFAAGLVGAPWRRVPALALRFPAQKAAIVAGMLAALAYALLAGMGIPVQRALLMLWVAGLALLTARTASPWRVLGWALFGVLVVDPWAALSAGFWLSFSAVATILLVVSGRLRAAPGWQSGLRLQWVLGLALVPALLVLFQQFSLVSPIANLVAIPVVSFLVAPLVLLYVLFPLDVLVVVAHAIFALLMLGLEFLAAQPFALWQQAAPPVWLAVVALAGIVWLLLPGGTPARWVGACALLPLLLWQPARPAPGTFRAVMLDVGQGLAVHVQTARHDLLFDTGPAWGSTNAGERVILPYLRAHGVRALDTLVLSHDDIDHTGGAQAILADLPVQLLLAELPPERTLWGQAAQDQACRAGQAWVWDEVSFRMLHPADADLAWLRDDNNRSCVLWVGTAAGALLLPGDAGRIAERLMIARDAAALKSDVVVAGHHGSRTSSTPVFIAATGASAALHSAGYLNAFGHPHPEVWANWARAGARNYRSDSQGAIELIVDASGPRLQAERERRPRYWFGR